MKFNFFPESSRIVQFVYFPALAGYVEDEKAFGSLIKDLINPGSLDRWERIAGELSSVREEFSKYQLSSYSYYFMIMFRTDICSMTDEEDYLKAVSALSRADLEEHLTQFMGKNLDLVIPQWDTSKNLADAFQIVSNSTLDNSDRWKLLALLDNPEAERDHYVAFMKRLIPLYRKFYKEVEFAVNSFAANLESQLALNLFEPFIELMNQYLIQESVEGLQKSHEINFWFLGIQDHHFYIIPDVETSTIILGISVLEYFSRLTHYEQRSKDDRITVFKNLSDKTRYEVLKLIAEGESSTKILAEKLGVTSAAISYHLEQLSNDRLIRFDAGRPKQRYRINEARMEEALAGLREDLNLT